jgi:hypothetical protein
MKDVLFSREEDDSKYQVSIILTSSYDPFALIVRCALPLRGLRLWLRGLREAHVLE